MSGVMFSRTPYGAAWSVQKYMEEVRGMGEYVWAEAVCRILIEAIQEMQRKLEGPVFDMQMNGFSLLIQVWFYEHTTRFAQHDKCMFARLARWDSTDHEGSLTALSVIPVLRSREEKMLVPTVRAFMKTDGFLDYILDGEGVLSSELHLEQTHEELCAEKGKHVDTLRMLEFWKSHANELEARLKMCTVPGEAQDIGHQPGGDVGEDVQSDSGLESLARVVTDLGEAAAHDLVRLRVGKRMQLARQQWITQVLVVMLRARHRGWPILLPLLMIVMIEPHVQPSAEVEDVGGRAVDATAMPCGEMRCMWEVIQQQGRVFARHPHLERQMCRDCTPVVMEGVEYESMVDPGMESVHHEPLMPVDNVAVDHEASTERTSLHADDVGCKDDGGEKSSNIVTRMRRKPRCRKPTAVHCSLFTDPTSLAGARKSKKEKNEGMTGVDEPCVANDHGEGSMYPSILDVQLLSVEGSGIAPSVEELNKLKLTK
ncbi:hypothetical protein Cgig2_033874 [Carnegiea gigantea]|uniref:Aminotransferase-like plant mobile domain-containing protein n=1 Tax=Carnegiea gigantea TaxID=171969 RepID=A0A9Q1Q8Z9_9CARY|nr:hypothetical protein Cgig2_033874 [Carnegiea gigantea]